MSNAFEAVQYCLRKIREGSLTVEDLAMLVPYAQRELGVADDGKPGAETLKALHDALGCEHSIVNTKLPVPKGRAGVKRVYGDPSWKKTGKGRMVDIDDAWEYANIRTFKLHNGKRVRLHRLVGDEFVRLFKAACEASGYTPSSVQTYVPRVIGGKDVLSMHAYGIAFDVDPSDNPWGGWGKSGLSKLRQHPEFVLTFERAGWAWGGRWSHGGHNGWGDDMHFERKAPNDPSEQCSRIPTERPF